MVLVWEPVFPWFLLGLAFFGLVALVLLWKGWSDHWRTLGRLAGTRLAVVLLSLVAAILWVISLGNPQLQAIDQPTPFHLVVVMDVSDSALRSEGGWDAMMGRASVIVDGWVEQLSAAEQAQASGSIVLFRDATVVRLSEHVSDLTALLSRLTSADFPAGDGSHLAAGITAAGEQIQAAGGRGVVLMMSDGYETTGDAIGAAELLAGRGIPLYVMPLEGVGPAVALTALDLPRLVDAGDTTYVRGAVQNDRDTDVTTLLTITRPFGMADINTASEAQSVSTIQTLPANQVGTVRAPVVFGGLGLQYLDILFQTPGDSEPFTRRLYTHVYRPPTILALGVNNRWISTIPEEAAVIREKPPELFDSTLDLRDVDAVVLSEVHAESLPVGGLEALAAQVENGVGLLLINGEHTGLDEKDPTVLMSYKDTPLDPLLPVSSEPRPFEEEPPTRQVVIFIDASGSMSGQPLAKAKELAIYIARNLMRPQDRLDVIAFTSDATHVLEDRLMDAAGIQAAVTAINGIQEGGGTDPRLALQRIAGRQLRDCGVIFISDGFFDPAALAVRPECRFTVFAIGGQPDPNSPLSQLGDPIAVGADFSPASVTIPYFEPEKRDRFFEPGEFPALGLTAEGGARLVLPIPSLPLNGSAITYIRPEGELVAVRPKVTDPVLAYRDNDGGMVAVFTSDIPDSWASDPAAQEAVSAWLEPLFAYEARDRYEFQLEDFGNTMALTITFASTSGVPVVIDRIEAVIELEGESPTPVTLNPAPNQPSTFIAFARPPRTDTARLATLVLREAGPDALVRPQRIPLVLPPQTNLDSALTSEAQSFGINNSLLEALTANSGGAVLYGDSRVPLVFNAATPPAEPLWQYLVVAGVLFYFGAIFARRWNP